MEWGIAAALIVGFIVAAVMLGVPIAVSLGLVSFIFIALKVGVTGALTTVSSEFAGFWSSYTLLALPLFIIMGEYLFAGGIAGNLFDFSSKWLRRIPGGLSMVTIGTGAIFGALSGSSLAAVATIGVTAIPQMLEKGYDKKLVAGSVMAAGGLAAVIPPSILMVLYAVLVEISVGRQLLAGFLPGLFLATIYGVVIVIWVRLRPDAAPFEPSVPWKERFRVLWKLVLPVSVALIVLGGIYTGVTTATEAAGVGALIAILMAFTFGKLSPRGALKSGMSAIQTTSFIMLIAVGGKLLSWCLTYYFIPQNIVNLLTSFSENRYVILVLIQIVFVLLGMFVDPISIVVVTVPILIPVLTALHFDLMWFGVLMAINMEMAIITPPLGFALYIVKGIMGDRASLGDILRGGLWFVLGQAVCIALLIVFPIIVTWIPDMMIAKY